jgi:hypothetical protein
VEDAPMTRDERKQELERHCTFDELFELLAEYKIRPQPGVTPEQTIEMILDHEFRKAKEK